MGYPAYPGKLAKVLDIEVFKLSMPVIPAISSQTEYEFEKIRRFAKDLILVLDASTSEASKSIKNCTAYAELAVFEASI